MLVSREWAFSVHSLDLVWFPSSKDHGYEPSSTKDNSGLPMGQRSIPVWARELSCLHHTSTGCWPEALLLLPFPRAVTFLKLSSRPGLTPAREHPSNRHRCCAWEWCRWMMKTKMGKGYGWSIHCNSLPLSLCAFLFRSWFCVHITDTTWM